MTNGKMETDTSKAAPCDDGRRPVPGWAQYETPIRKLWMCGSATHPGGGIMGAPGRNAALRILGQRS